MSKKYGECVICDICKRKINVQEAHELGNTEKISNTTIIYCECGNEIPIMDKK